MCVLHRQGHHPDADAARNTVMLFKKKLDEKDRPHFFCHELKWKISLTDIGARTLFERQHLFPRKWFHSSL